MYLVLARYLLFFVSVKDLCNFKEKDQVSTLGHGVYLAQEHSESGCLL